MKHQLIQILQQTLKKLQNAGELPQDIPITIQLEQPRDKKHGDFACNIALILAKQLALKPRDIAEKIIAHLPTGDFIQQVTIAGPGFINFFLASDVWRQIIPEILQAKSNYGRSAKAEGKSIHIEFVSSNPTGPLHVGHGRSAAYGASLANLLEAIGYRVHREYYVNDAGRQMDILATSVWLRYLQLCGENLHFPVNGYQGDYVVDIAKQLQSTSGQSLSHSAQEVFREIPPDENKGGDKETHIDALINRAKQLLGESVYLQIFNLGLNTILEDIRGDLAAFGVQFQEWFSERSLVKSGEAKLAIEKLSASTHVYERDGALWFNSTAFGDDKDRVLLRENGQPTYFAMDAAYRFNVLQRGYDKLINILGADHHGYVARIRAVIQAMGFDPKVLTIPIVQFAVLYRGKDRVPMSTRSGSFVTLRELREEVSTDAARFFYVMRKCEQHMDFDLELAKSQSNDNPVYYIQYAHARICSVLRQLAERALEWNETVALQALPLLETSYELELMQILARFKEIIEISAEQYEPHLLAHYLRELAHAFHTYYNANIFIVENENIRNARIALIIATRYTLANGLKLLGVSAPETM